MAVLTNPVVLYQDPPTQGKPRIALLAFGNVTTADTFDCSTLSPPFTTVTHAFTFPTSNRTATAVVGTIATNTVVSLLGTGIARDSCVLAVLGE